MLIEEGIVPAERFRLSPPASDTDLIHAHAPDYVAAIESGAISQSAMRRIGFPWSPFVAKRARATTGGAIAAAKAALQDGFSGQLAGGAHHAHYDFGAGYCVFNDFAVAALALIAEGLVSRVAIIDLDVHQGDGNAAILSPRDDVFVLSVHGEKNFPFRKTMSDLDLNLPDGVEDTAYLAAVIEVLPAVWAFQPEIVLYQAGVDPLKEDRLGRMALSHEGLRNRDELVLSECQRRGIPVSLGLGGGYADPIGLSVEAHANTYRAAKAVYGF